MLRIKSQTPLEAFKDDFEGSEAPGAFVSAECLERNLLFAVLLPSGLPETFEGLPSEAFEGLWRPSEGL